MSILAKNIMKTWCPLHCSELFCLWIWQWTRIECLLAICEWYAPWPKLCPPYLSPLCLFDPLSGVNINKGQEITGEGVKVENKALVAYGLCPDLVCPKWKRKWEREEMNLRLAHPRTRPVPILNTHPCVTLTQNTTSLWFVSWLPRKAISLQTKKSRSQ